MNRKDSRIPVEEQLEKRTASQPVQRREFLQGALAVGGLLACDALPLHAGDASTPIAPDPQVEHVLVMFKCHLDVGFSNTQENVVRLYFDRYYPQAMRTAAEMRQQGSDRYIWTTGSWLLYEYLEQASSEQRKRMDEAVLRGDIAWHALPFNWQTEVLDRSMIQGSLALSRSLDRRYGQTTCGAKMTDVPCHSRGLIGPLAQGGVKFLDIGVNAASTAPQVPSLFIWKNPQAESIIVMYHHRGYGGTVKVPQSNLAISIQVRGDNSGPHTIEEIKTIYANLRRQFPNARVEAATLTQIALAVEKHSNTFPVVTQEIGDTWIYGVASDPVKVARYREIARLRQEWIDQRKFSIGDATDRKLLPDLLLVPEHTWGTDTKRYLDYDHYSPAQLAQMVDTKPYRIMEISWSEKRDDIDHAIAALPPVLHREAIERLRALAPVEPEVRGLQTIDLTQEIDTPHFTLRVDSKTGAISRLFSKQANREWATPQKPLGLFVYQTLSQADYTNFFASYIVSKAPWAAKDFGKPNIDSFGPKSMEWIPQVIGGWSDSDAHGVRLLLQLQVDNTDPQVSKLVAWPGKLYMEIFLPRDEPVVRLRLSWFAKAANRMPEALWLSFLPSAPQEQNWTLNKVNQPVSPFDVVAGGNRHMHAISDVVRYHDQRGSFSIESLDAPLVVLGERSPLHFSNSQPVLQKGIHFSLFNNAWGTNYPQWFGEAMSFRFNLRA